MSASSAELRNSAAVSPDFDIRMSSGPSAWNEKPRSARSSCIEETPISSAIASTRPMPRSARARSIWLNRSSIKREPRVRDERPSRFDRIGVAIEAHHPSRPRREHGARIPARSKSAVDHGFAIVDAERRDHLVDQHRHMWGRT